MSTSVVSQSSRFLRKHQPLSLRHALLVYVSPRSLFDRVEDTGAYGWALMTLLLLVVLTGYATLQTGLIDRVVDQQTERRLAELEESRAQLIDRVELSERMADIRKESAFNKLIARLGVIVFAPAGLLVSLLAIASVLYALVALTGRSPEYHTLMSICVYGAFVELVGYVVRLAMMLYYRTTEVETSLGRLATAGEATPLVALDPFRIWFGVLVVIGLCVTQQLSRRMAVVTCTLMALIAGGVRVAFSFASA